MKLTELLQIILFFGVGIAFTPVLGRYLARVFKGEKTFLHPLLFPVEKLVYRLSGVAPDEEMSWLEIYVVGRGHDVCGLRLPDRHIDDPEMAAVEYARFGQPLMASGVNTAWSFTCNADWQSYSGEAVMTYLSQTLGLSVHQFISGAAGLAILVAVGRALARASVKSIGNFWVDLTRCTLYVVIPLSILWAIPLAWQGVPQTWKSYPIANLVEPYMGRSRRLTKGTTGNCAGAEIGRPGQAGDGARRQTRDDDQPVMVDQKVETQRSRSARSRRSSPASNFSPTEAAVRRQ